MRISQTIRLGLLVLGLGLGAAAQNDSQSQPAPAPAPAFGQNAPVLNPENPPLSGLDEPRLDLRQALRSFISTGLQVSQSADTNTGNQLGSAPDMQAVTRVLGALDLQRFWPKSDLFAEYLGGGAFYASGVQDVRQLQAVGLQGVTRWRTGQLTLRDSFNYLPEGSFSAGAYGGTPGLGIAEVGGFAIPGGGVPGTHSFGGEQFGSVGLVSRITNVTIGDMVQSLTPRSAFTIAGGFSMAHFLELQDILFNSRQVTVQGGYSYLLNRRDQLAGIYAFQEFHFPQSETGRIDAHVFNLRWGRTLSGRMSFRAGAGPQYVSIYQPGGSFSSHWSVSGRATLHYKFQRSSIEASYEKFTSAGSGLYAGADTQVARFSLNRPLTRTLEFMGDLGYSHNKKLQFSLMGLQGNNYDDGFAGAVLRKQIGRSYAAFAAYRFNELGLDVPECQGSIGCGHISQRHIGTIGVEWHPRPIRIE